MPPRARPPQEEATLLAAAEVGSEKKEYVWPRKESPTPVGISTMVQHRMRGRGEGGHSEEGLMTGPLLV